MKVNEILAKKYADEISKLETELEDCESLIRKKELLKKQYKRDIIELKKIYSKKIKWPIIIGSIGFTLTLIDLIFAINGNYLDPFNLKIDIFSFLTSGMVGIACPLIIRNKCRKGIDKREEDIFVKELELSNLEQEKMEKEREITFKVIDSNKLNAVQYEYVDSPTMVNTINDTYDEPMVRTRKL